MSKQRVVGSIVSKNGVTLFYGDGSSEVLTKDAWKTQAILMAVMGPIASEGYAEIDLNEFKVEKLAEALADESIVIEKTETGGAALIVEGERIESAEILKTQIEAIAIDPGNAVGVKNFLKAFAKVAKERRFSAEDLLKFMKRADLPLADDGSVIAYKVLRRAPNGEGYRDVHSGRVPQRVGSLVSMPIDKVDPDRTQSCSYGLHVCSRSYIGSFDGDIVTLVKVKVEDVIAVPINEGNKMRVRAYHILGELSQNGYSRARSNQTITGVDSDAALLRAAISGDHLFPIEIVKHDGRETIVEPLQQPKSVKRARKASDVVVVGETNTKALQQAFDQAIATSAKIEPSDVINKALKKPAKVKETLPPPAETSVPGVILGNDAFEGAIKGEKIAPSRLIGKTSPYEEKIVEAQRLKDGGWSLREIEKQLGMCRKSLAKKLA